MPHRGKRDSHIDPPTSSHPSRVSGFVQSLLDSIYSGPALRRRASATRVHRRKISQPIFDNSVVVPRLVATNFAENSVARAIRLCEQEPGEADATTRLGSYARRERLGWGWTTRRSDHEHRTPTQWSAANPIQRRAAGAGPWTPPYSAYGQSIASAAPSVIHAFSISRMQARATAGSRSSTRLRRTLGTINQELHLITFVEA